MMNGWLVIFDLELWIDGTERDTMCEQTDGRADRYTSRRARSEMRAPKDRRKSRERPERIIIKQVGNGASSVHPAMK